MNKRKGSFQLLLGLLFIFWIALGVSNPLVAKIPRPEDFLGFKVGTDRKLADREESPRANSLSAVAATSS